MLNVIIGRFVKKKRMISLVGCEYIGSILNFLVGISVF